MIRSIYVVTGTQRTTRYYLQPSALATGFIKDAEKFCEREKAQRAADRENDLRVWGFRWSVEQRQFDVITGEAV